MKHWVYFDVDETLVLWEGANADAEKFPIKLDIAGWRVYGKPHQRHVDALKKHKQLGDAVVVVWSAGGQDHAEEVVRQLGIGEYVDYILAKPDQYYDDLHCEEFMGKWEYLNLRDNTNEGDE